MAPNDNTAKIPAWQRATSLPGAEGVKAEATPAAEPTKADAKEATHELARSEEAKSKDDIDGLRDSALKFLNDPSIKDAPRERKAAFLESKGLKKEEIDLLLSSLPATAQVAPTPQPPQQPQQAPRDIPPVISYPEFLVQAEKPQPLVTKTLLLNTAYATAGIYGTLYALSKYIITPMQAQLSDARHDLITHSTNQLDAFNSKLSAIVSTPPASGSRPATALRQRDEDEESESSDPTELFHRDFGTQTSPPVSRRNSLSSPTSDTTSPTDHASTTLTRLTTSLRDLTTSSESKAEADDTSNQLSQLVTTLNEMAYASSSYYKYGAGSGGYGWASGEKAQDDEIERLVKEVKALKGRFLGVRNFPRVGVR